MVEFVDEDSESCIIPESVNYGKESYPVAAIGEHAFSNQNKLTSVVIPDSVTEIKDSAFYDCDGLNYVDFGHGVTAIKEHAFYSCDNLKTVKNGEKISAIDQQVFMVLQLNRSIYCQV